MSGRQVFPLSQLKQKAWWFWALALPSWLCGAGYVVALDGPNLRFSAIQEEEGLSYSTVNAVLQDRHGFLWLGTNDGLNRYDGLRFRVYKYEPRQPRSLADSFVQCLFETKAGVLWVGTSGGGLCRYQNTRDEFERFQFHPNELSSLPNDYVSDMAEDAAGNLWVATIGGGLAVFDPATQRFARFQYRSGEEKGLFSNEVWALSFDREGHLWFGTYDGLGVIPFATLDKLRQNALMVHQVTRERHGLSDNRVRTLLADQSGAVLVGTYEGGLNEILPRRISTDTVDLEVRVHRKTGQPFALEHEDVRDILEDPEGRVWLATDGGGLYLWQRTRGKFYRYSHARERAYTISSNRALSLARDRSGLIWIGTADGGVNRLDLKRSQFDYWSEQREDEAGLHDQVVRAIQQDNQGRLWVATDNGVDVIPLATQTAADTDLAQIAVQHLHRRPNGKGPRLSHNYVRALAEDARGRMWLGTWGGGLNRVDLATETVTVFRSRAKDPTTLSNNYVRALLPDQNGVTLWIGTSNGLNRLHLESDTLERLTFDRKDLNGFGQNRIASIFQDEGGQLWLGGDGGLVSYEPQSGRHQVFRHDPLKHNSLSNNRVRPITARQANEIWIGTAGGGLNRFNPLTQTFTAFRLRDGLPNETVKALLFENDHFLWISTSGGLARLDLDNLKFTNFTTREGLIGNQFNDLAAFRAPNGTFFFGGTDGLTFFDPATLQFNRQVPNLAITDVLVDGNPLPYAYSGRGTKPLIIPPNRKSFSFEFAVLDFTDPDKNTYAYMLEGYEDNWIELQAQPRINYTNIDPGDYVFRVKGANNHGLWNEKGTALRLQVLAPWWRSTPAMLGWVGLAFGSLLLLYTVLSWRREAAHQNALNQAATELEREQRVAERLRQLDKLKDSFLANTSHELRTPLNGIMGIVESLIEGVTGDLHPKTKANLAMVLNSAKRLSNLVNDILDYSKLKERTIDLHLKAVDLRSVSEVVLLLNRPMAAKKGLVLHNRIPADAPLVQADENRLQQILHNLIGNAVKYTDSGEVEILLQKRDRIVQLTVRDSGIGMSREQQSRIFASFEQGDQSIERVHGGTGLGLAITKQLVKLHGGVIWAESEQGKGSSFHFTLPQVAADNALPSGDSVSESDHMALAPAHLDLDPSLVTPAASVDGQALTIMVVDDEPVNLQVLVNLLSLKKYNIVQAANGEEALDLLNQSEKSVDLVILDVMMPRLSGFEVCMRIRERWTDRELPVILLTARGQVADMAMGFEAGANDYLTKPVSKEELLPRVETHLALKDMDRDLSQARLAAEAGAHAKESAIFATSILHNIGNVLNSLKVSTQQTQHKLSVSKVHRLKLAGAMLAEQETRLLAFLRDDPKGRMLPNYFMGIGNILADENSFMSKQLEDIHKKTELMQEIIEIQQRHAKADRQGVESFDLQAVVDECLRFMHNLMESREITLIRHDTPATPLPVQAQRVHTLQIVMNLFKNAMEAMEESPRETRTITVSSGTRGDGRITLSIRDSGIGISATQMKRLFAHGYTTKKTGHGFGLHYCRDVMAAMDGEIMVSSEGTGQGACFTLAFAPCPQNRTTPAKDYEETAAINSAQG